MEIILFSMAYQFILFLFPLFIIGVPYCEYFIDAHQEIKQQ